MRNNALLVFLLFLAVSFTAIPASGQDESRISKLEEELAKLKAEIDSLKAGRAGKSRGTEDDDLRRLAEEAASEEEGEGAGTPAGKGAGTVFKSGALSLQALNPEISAVGDLFYTFTHAEGSDEWKRGDFVFRGVGLHFEGYVDPYTRFKAAIPVSAVGAELGEAYMTRIGVFEGLSITAGKFRQQFGTLNRWHKPALDQLDFPMALRMIFGNGGLNQIGLSFDFKAPPLWASSQELCLQVTNGQNPSLFAGNALSTPATLLRYKSYWDLSDSTYFEAAVTGLAGWRDSWLVDHGAGLEEDRKSLWAAVTCIEFTLNYEPASKMRYFCFEWRTEIYTLNREILAPDGSGRDQVNAWGFTTILHWKLDRTIEAGLQGGLYEPDFKAYAGWPGAGLEPHATADKQAFKVHGAVYATWWQSPFVRFHLQYDYMGGNRSMGRPEHSVTLQVVFAIGPHKHERY